MSASVCNVQHPRAVRVTSDQFDPIDPTAGNLIQLTQVPRLPWMPRNRRGKPIHVNTVWRWFYRGIRGVKLRTILLGGCRYTSVEALQDFFRRTSGPDGSQGELSTASRRRQRDLAASRVAELLRPTTTAPKGGA